MKKVLWVGSSYKDFMKFPTAVRHAVGYVLYYAQMGKRHEHMKTRSGMGNGGVTEIRENDSSGTFRVMYTVELEGFVFVLHAFQKKSKSGKATPQQELELLKDRIKEARALHKMVRERKTS